MIERPGPWDESPNKTPQDQLGSLLVKVEASLMEAMKAIERGGAQIALVVDDQRRLFGTISDGDIRRALIRGAALKDPASPYFQRKPLTVAPETGRAEALDLMKAHRLEQIPVVSTDGQVRGLHLMHDLIGPMERPNSAVIMAGGRGTRLAPLTQDLPKPMMAIAGRPILERIVLHLAGAGIRRIYLAVNYLADKIESHFGDGSSLGCQIDYLREDPTRPLGTAGALSMLPAEASQQHPLLVMNGDLLTRFSVGGFIEHHHVAEAAVTVASATYAHRIPFATMEVGSDGLLIALHEKPTPNWSINAGVYLISPEAIKLIPPGVEYDLTRLIEELIAKGERVAAWPIDGEWMDIGRADDLREARGEDWNPR